MRRSWPRLVALLLLTPLLVGCWDRVEVEDQAYVISLGLDQGEKGRIMVTASVAAVTEIGPAGAGESRAKGRSLARELLTSEGSTITQALHILNGSMTRRLDFRHLRAILVGEPLARRGVESLVMELQRNSLVRGSVAFIQVRNGRAFDVLSADRPVGEVNPAKMEEGFILMAKQVHLTPPIRMHQFLIRMAARGGDPFTMAAAVNPLVRPGAQVPEAPKTGQSAFPGELGRGGGNPVEQIGTAIYQYDRLKGFLNVDETQMLLALRGEMGKAYVSFPDPEAPDYTVTMRFHQENRPTMRSGFRGNQPYVEVRVLFEGEVLAAPGGADFTHPELRDRLEKAAIRYAEETARKMLEKLKAWEADPVGFGHLFRGGFLTWREWEQYDWPKHVRDLAVEVEFDMRIRRYGLTVGGDRVKEER